MPEMDLRQIDGGMDMKLANLVAAASMSVQQFIIGALWSEVEKLGGADRANQFVRMALSVAEARDAAICAIRVEVTENA